MPILFLYSYSVFIFYICVLPIITVMVTVST